jgi:hypothetical protein
MAESDAWCPACDREITVDAMMTLWTPGGRITVCAECHEALSPRANGFPWGEHV